MRIDCLLLLVVAVPCVWAEGESKLPPDVKLRTSRHYVGDWKHYENAKAGDFAEYEEGRAGTHRRREIVEVGDHFVVELTTVISAGEITQSAVKTLFKNPNPLPESKNRKSSDVQVRLGDKDHAGKLVEFTTVNQVISRQLFCEAVPFEGLVWSEGADGKVSSKLLKYGRDGREFEVKDKPGINVAAKGKKAPKSEGPGTDVKVAEKPRPKDEKIAGNSKTAGEATYKGKVAAEWVAQLKDKDAGKRAEATVALRALGPKAQDAAPDLIRALKDKEPDVRAGAALALGMIGVKEAVPDLAALLQDKMGNVKIDAARALAFFKADAAPAMGALLEVLKQEKNPARAAVIDVLREIGPDSRPAVPVLIVLVQGKDAVLARGAVGALGAIGPDAKEAVPAITEATKNKDPIISGAACVALWKIDPETAESLKIPKPKAAKVKKPS